MQVFKRKDLRSTARFHAAISGIVQVFGAGDDEPLRALIRPASEKRQGTKSRSVGQRRCRRRYGD